MAPKKQSANSTTNGSKNTTSTTSSSSGSKGQKHNNKKSRSNDDDDEFNSLLDGQMKVNAKINKELEAKKLVEKNAQEKVRKDQAAATLKLQAEKMKREADLPPIYVNEVAEMLFLDQGGDGNEDDFFIYKCWLHLCLFNFFNRVLESRRLLLFRSAEFPDGEPVESFECRDLTLEEDSPYSWMILKTATTQKLYNLDLTICMFDDAEGRPDGFERDAGSSNILGFVPVLGASRLRSIVGGDADISSRRIKVVELKDADGEEAKVEEVGKNGDSSRSAPLLHPGFMSKGGGVFPNCKAQTIVKRGVPKGTNAKYVDFLEQCKKKNFQGMSPAELKEAKLISQNPDPLIQVHEELEKWWFTKPLDAVAAAADQKKAE